MALLWWFDGLRIKIRLGIFTICECNEVLEVTEYCLIVWVFKFYLISYKEVCSLEASHIWYAMFIHGMIVKKAVT